ncbi:Serine/threonine-protein kinase Nek2 [Phlyctochytrium bullatum]|nr:Serine/threonine-protein kinase Nek2 [Phlyctochytrium bullatum]
MTLYKGSFGLIRKILARKEIDYRKMTEKEKRQLVAEVNILRELRHPNIVRYYERFVDRENCMIYIIMDGAQNVKLGDFGLSRVIDNPESEFAKTFVGTPFYMSPELVNESCYNTKSDVWALVAFLNQAELKRKEEELKRRESQLNAREAAIRSREEAIHKIVGADPTLNNTVAASLGKIANENMASADRLEEAEQRRVPDKADDNGKLILQPLNERSGSNSVNINGRDPLPGVEQLKRGHISSYSGHTDANHRHAPPANRTNPSVPSTQYQSRRLHGVAHMPYDGRAAQALPTGRFGAPTLTQGSPMYPHSEDAASRTTTVVAEEGIVLAGISDINRPVEKLSFQQNFGNDLRLLI